MKTGIALVVALGIGAGMSVVSAQDHGDKKKFDKGSPITLQGCVVAAEKKDTYVLTNVREWPVADSDMGKYGKRYYWIDKGSKDLKNHVGHTVQVMGKISDVEKSEMELKAGENGMGMTVEIEGPGKDVKTSASNAQVDAAAQGEMKDVPITLLKMKVDDIKMMSSTCSTMQ